MPFDRELPQLLHQFHELEFYVDEDDCIDYEPYTTFWPAEENTDWIRAWTRNDELDGQEFRVFAEDGSGGVVGFWLVRDGGDQNLEQQPIVFMGSEGGTGVVAHDLADYVWLVAQGVGPCEAVEMNGAPCPVPDALRAFAEKHTPDAKKSVEEILERARAAHPGFSEWVDRLCP